MPLESNCCELTKLESVYATHVLRLGYPTTTTTTTRRNMSWYRIEHAICKIMVPNWRQSPADCKHGERQWEGILLWKCKGDSSCQWMFVLLLLLGNWMAVDSRNKRCTAATVLPVILGGGGRRIGAHRTREYNVISTYEMRFTLYFS